MLRVVCVLARGTRTSILLVQRLHRAVKYDTGIITAADPRPVKRLTPSRGRRFRDDRCLARQVRLWHERA